MSEIYTFTREAIEEISRTYPQLQELLKRGQSLSSMPQHNNSEIWYAQLTEKDPDGNAGFWAWEEAFYNGPNWELRGGRLGDGDEYRYIRHISWEDAEIGQIVQVKTILNRETAQEELVFTSDVTNPEAFVFYADDNGGTGQARSDSQWTMKNGGKVLTNVGTADIQAGFTVQAGDSVQIVMTFVDLGDGFELVSAVMANGQGQYWNESDGIIIVNWRICEVETVGDVGRLKQFHAGDVHLEIFGFASDPENPETPTNSPNTFPVKVEGDNDWILVVRNGNTYTVQHILPDPDKVWKTLKVIDPAFSCDAASFSTVQDAEDWANDLIDNLKLITVDDRGHVVECADCDGENGENPPVDYELLESTLVSDLVGSDIRPEAVGGEGITVDYKILNDGNNYPDYIGIRDAVISLKNDLGDTVSFDVFDILDANMPAFNKEKLENNAGTSGRSESELFMSVRQFRFNATVTIRVAVVGLDLTQIKVHNTANCSATHTDSATIIRDKDDPNAEAFTTKVSYSLSGLESGYDVEIDFKVGETSIPYSLQGQGGPFLIGPSDIALDNVSETATITVWFDLSDVDTGAVIKYCSKLLTISTNYNANVEQCSLLQIQSETDCVVDQNGSQVSDGTADCITEGSQPAISKVFKRVSDNTEIGIYTTSSDFLWTQDPGGGVWRKAYADTGATVTPITCVLDNGKSSAANLVLSEFSVGNLTTFPIDNGCNIIEAGAFPFPTRSGSGPINHAFPAGSTFREMIYRLGPTAIIDDSDFEFKATINTNDIDLGGDRGQVLVAIYVSWSGGNTTGCGVIHNDPGLTSKVGYKTTHNSTADFSGANNVNHNMTRANYSGELKIARVGTQVTATIDGSSSNYVIGASETITNIQLVANNTAGPGSRTVGWDFDLTNLTITDL